VGASPVHPEKSKTGAHMERRRSNQVSTRAGLPDSREQNSDVIRSARETPRRREADSQVMDGTQLTPLKPNCALENH
jgi:hypothetical protein